MTKVIAVDQYDEVIEYLAHKMVDDNIDEFIENSPNDIDPKNFSNYNLEIDIVQENVHDMCYDILSKVTEIQSLPETIEIVKEKLCIEV